MRVVHFVFPSDSKVRKPPNLPLEPLLQPGVLCALVNTVYCSDSGFAGRKKGGLPGILAMSFASNGGEEVFVEKKYSISTTRQTVHRSLNGSGREFGTAVFQRVAGGQETL
jgi:hypothetical protein